MERWEERWNHKLDEIPELPERVAFEWQTITYGEGRGRYPSVSGWLFKIEDVEFIYGKDVGMCVILACPDCGERHADSWYGLADLGKKLKSQRTMFHKCQKVAARELAYAIKSATDATKLPADVIFEEALEVMRDWRA